MRLIALGLLFFAFPVGCTSAARHSTHYQCHRDYRSLASLLAEMRESMPQQQVEQLLGSPDYSPTEGQFYYSTDRQDSLGRTYGLVVDYRTDERLTEQLQEYWFGAIGE